MESNGGHYTGERGRVEKARSPFLSSVCSGRPGVCARNAEGDVVKAFVGFFGEVESHWAFGGGGVFVAIDAGGFADGEGQGFPGKIGEGGIPVNFVGVAGVGEDRDL